MIVRKHLRRVLAQAFLLSSLAASGAEVLVDPRFAAFQHVEHDQGAYIVREASGNVVCNDATPLEAQRINRRGNVPLKVFGEERGRVRTNAGGGGAGLHIILRGTAQLDANPEAKAAFERAAAIWESRISNNITVYVDVDYGTTRFGEPYEENVLASASSDTRGGSEGIYPEVRGLIVARADNAAETALYGSLPVGTIPTDLGATTRIASPSILLRALGAMPAVAVTTDSAPSIGFNSAYLYDFDPSNGITPGRRDFEGVVTHEIGHMLGFTSRVGSVELGSTINAPTILDFYRFRPGVAGGTFASAQRIQSSGGEHVFFNGAAPLALSTGRPDGTGGDEQQSSHWKDDRLTGTRIGIMDPTLSSGVRSEITANDLAAFNVLGYTIGGGDACSETEPNETAANASALTLGTPCSGNAAASDPFAITVTYPNSTTDRIEDLFRIVLPAPGKVTVSLSMTAQDLDVFLFSISGSAVTTIDNASSTGLTETFTTEDTLAAGTYYIGVSAFDGSSSYTLTATSSVAAPAAPTNFVASLQSSTIAALSWSDNATNETGYIVEKKTGTGAFEQLGTLAANATSATVSNLAPGVTYTFRVKAYNAAGSSAYSNESSVTAPSGPTTCTASSTTVCLLGNRFRVNIAYRNQFSNPPGQTGDFAAARLNPAATNPDTALFGFGNAQNVEVVVRIVDARPFAPRFDIYYGGLTDVEYTVSVTDTQTGLSKQYKNNPGQVGGGVDRSTFPAN